jgi:hypothetical protein
VASPAPSLSSRQVDWLESAAGEAEALAWGPAQDLNSTRVLRKVHPLCLPAFP